MKLRSFVALALAGVTATTLCAIAAPAAAITTTATIYQEKLASGNDFFAYIPAGEDTGVRAAATPILLVLGDKPFTSASAKATAEQSGLADIARTEQGVVAFVNAKSTTWTASDTAGINDALNRYLDTTGVAYDKNGQHCEANPITGATSCGYPGAKSRVYVFASGAAADFVDQNLIPGIATSLPFPDANGNPIVQNWTPAAVWLSGAKASVAAPKYATEVPAYLVGAAPSVANQYAALNTRHNLFATARPGSPAGFNKATITEGYRGVISHAIQRSSLAQPAMQTYKISDYAAEGLTTTTATYTVNGAPIKYFTYAPHNITGKVPLVMAFHGGGNQAEYLMFSTGWPDLAAQYGFIVVSVDQHVERSASEIITLLDHIEQSDHRIDTSRVYATGFSMGSVKTWQLGEQFPDRFAAIAPMHGSFAPSVQTPPTTPLPAIYFAGLLSGLPEQPHQECGITGCGPRTANDIDTRLNAVFTQNNVAENWTYDESADPTWGIKATTTFTQKDTEFAGVADIVNEYASKDGRILTALAGTVNGAHEALSIEASIAWQFMSQYSRGNDASVHFVDRAPSLQIQLDTPNVWPPDNKAHTVTVNAFASDFGPTTTRIVDVQATNGGQIKILDDSHVSVVARKGTRYTVTVEARDSAGNANRSRATIVVGK